jgi:hypothetical protein
VVADLTADFVADRVIEHRLTGHDDEHLQKAVAVAQRQIHRDHVDDVRQ